MLRLATVGSVMFVMFVMSTKAAAVAAVVWISKSVSVSKVGKLRQYRVSKAIATPTPAATMCTSCHCCQGYSKKDCHQKNVEIIVKETNAIRREILAKFDRVEESNELLTS